MLDYKGFITLDYLFAFVLVMVFSAMLFAFTLTLSVVEIVQYMTFAAARNYSVAHVTEGDQKALAEFKFESLRRNPILQPLFKNNWFELGDPEVGLHSRDYESAFLPGGGDDNLFRGVRVEFVAKVLDFEAPIFGSTSNSDKAKGFSTEIGSYLGKEPNYEDCMNFTNLRWKWIKDLPSSFGVDYGSVQTQDPIVIADNGC